jgi:hypothetical protein
MRSYDTKGISFRGCHVDVFNVTIQGNAMTFEELWGHEVSMKVVGNFVS